MVRAWMSSGLPYFEMTLEPGSKREMPRRLLSAGPFLGWGFDCWAVSVPARTVNPATIAINRRVLFNVRDLKNGTALSGKGTHRKGRKVTARGWKSGSGIVHIVEISGAT